MSESDAGGPACCEDSCACVGGLYMALLRGRLLPLSPGKLRNEMSYIHSARKTIGATFVLAAVYEAVWKLRASAKGTNPNTCSSCRSAPYYTKLAYTLL